MRGDGSNHSGEVPKRFLRVLRDETVTAPEHLARMIACREKQRTCRIWKFLITLWALPSLFILLCQVAREAVQCSFIISLKHAHNWMQACSLSLTLSQKVKEGEKWSDNRVMWHSQEKEKKTGKEWKWWLDYLLCLTRSWRPQAFCEVPDLAEEKKKINCKEVHNATSILLAHCKNWIWKRTSPNKHRHH